MTLYLQLKFVSEAGAVMLVGMFVGGIIYLASNGEARPWLKGISPTVFFIGEDKAAGPWCA
jgi:hypothetical protein